MRAISLFCAWSILLGGGFWQLLSYSSTPGAPAQVQSQWPQMSTLPIGKGQATLLAFFHPQCPCSRATMTELERLMPHVREQAQVLIVFFKPSSRSQAWVQGTLWKKAQTLPHARIVIDEDGKEAAYFDAQTSGQILLYDADGRMVFSGGITPSRGHAGDSRGRDAIVAFFDNPKSQRFSRTAVFGCSLRGKNADN